MSARWCFKCQELGHIASNYPNRKVKTLAEWKSIEQDDEERGREESVEDEKSLEEEVIGPDEGKHLSFSLY